MDKRPLRHGDEIGALLADLREAWSVGGLLPADPASLDDIAAFESRHNVRLPDDLRAYFEILNGCKPGMGEFTSDRETAFWRLDEIERWSESEGSQPLFLFADYLISSIVYGIALRADTAPTPVFKSWGRGHVVRCAESFTDFVKAYVGNDLDMLL